MAFVKREIKDRVVQYPRRYQLVEVQPGIFDLIPVTGTVTEEGTPVNKELLQRYEDGLDAALEKTGDGKDVIVTFTEAATEAHIASGEKLSTLFGKILKKFKNIKDLIDNANPQPIIYSGTVGANETIEVCTFDINQVKKIYALGQRGAFYDVLRPSTLLGWITNGSSWGEYIVELTSTNKDITTASGNNHKFLARISGTTVTISITTKSTPGNYTLYLY